MMMMVAVVNRKKQSYLNVTQFTALNLYAVKYDGIPKLKSVKYASVSQLCISGSEHTELNGWNMWNILCCEHLSKIQSIYLQAEHIM